MTPLASPRQCACDVKERGWRGAGGKSGALADSPGAGIAKEKPDWKVRLSSVELTKVKKRLGQKLLADQRSQSEGEAPNR